MPTAIHRVFDPLVSPARAGDMLRLCERFGRYGTYTQEASPAEIGQGLYAVMNFVRTDGRFGRHADVDALVRFPGSGT